MRFQIGTSKGHGGRRYQPYVFTEQGVAILSGVLRSKRAVQVNILIMRAFVLLHHMIATNDELAALFTGDCQSRFITYCGGGIAASSNAFFMTRLGFTDVAVYTASLQEWAADPDNPLEIGAP